MVVDKIIVSNAAPSDKHVVWIDTSNTASPKVRVCVAESWVAC